MLYFNINEDLFSRIFKNFARFAKNNFYYTTKKFLICLNGTNFRDFLFFEKIAFRGINFADCLFENF